MSKHARVLGVGTVVLAVAAAFLAGDLTADEKTARDGIEKLAKSLEKGNADKAVVDSLKKENLDDIMNLFKLRKSGGFGVGKPGEFPPPDGIELKFNSLGKKTIKADLDKQGDAIAEAAYRAAAIAEIAAHKCPIPKKMGEKDPKDWEKWTKGMKESALELAKAAQAKDAKKVEAVAKKLNDTCAQCHGVFRD
jgi:hypothetical protein